MGSRGSGEMNNIMMEEDDPMDLGKPMSADEFRDRFDEGRDPGPGFYRHSSVHQLDNLEEVIAQALPRDRGAMERDTEREGMPLETVIPYDFDPMRDTIIIDIPRGYGAASGKTMEIKCHRFKPGAAVAIPVPKFTAAGRVARGSAVGSASDSRTMGTTFEAKPAPSLGVEPAPSTTGTTGTTGTGSDETDNATAAKSVLASRAKSATRTTTVSQLCAHGNSTSDDVNPTTEEVTLMSAEVTLMDELGRLIDGGGESDGSGDETGAVSGEPPGGCESAQSGRRSAQEVSSADGIWFTDKKVDADRRRDEKVDFRGEATTTAAAAAARDDRSTPGTNERSVSETKADMDEMGVPLEDLEGWVVDSPAKKDRLKKKKKKKLTWFFGKSSGWGFFGSGKKRDLDAQGLHLKESALEQIEKSGRGETPSSRRASMDEPRRNSFDGNRRRSGEWQRPDPWSGMMPRAGQPPVKRSSGKSIVSHGSSGSIESLKEALAARQNSFGLVQRADSMTVPNGTGGRAFKVVACQGLTVQDDHAWNEGDQREGDQNEPRPRSPDRVARPSQVDSNGRRRSSLDSESGDESGPVVMPRSNYVQRMERKERRETSAGGDGSTMRRRTGRAVDKKNVPGVLYLDDMPFAEGGFAKVYRGAFNNDGLSIAVAIKQMTYSLPEGETPTSLKFSRDFTSRDERSPADKAKDKLRGMGRSATREVEISKLCTHRNVVSHIMDHTGPSTDPADIAKATIREEGEAEHEPFLGELSRWKTYIITEFCIGGSLRDILRQPELVAATKQVRSSAAQLCVLKQVVEGMNYLHSIGVVHNDLKASNVLLHPSGETNCRWSAKIGDFGIARRIPPGHARVPLDIMNGTVSHMAPELLNDRFMSRATDVYSFGVLLWEIAAQGETPFSGIDAVDIVAAVVKHDLRPKFAENAFRPLVQLATRCWHADPNERPSFDQIGVDLLAWEPLVTFQRVENVTYMPIREGTELSGADATLTEGIDDNDATNPSQASSEMPLSTASVESLEVHARELRIAGGE